MAWISLVCLLALSSSAFANYGQSNGYGSSSFAKMPSLLNVMREQIRRPVLPTAQLPSQGYGQQSQGIDQTFVQQDLPKMQGGYGSHHFHTQKALPMHSFHKVHQGYGAAPRVLSFDQPQEVQQVPILTEADQLCRGQVAETVIPLENGRKFIVCLDDSKGVEQYCPKGLFYHLSSRRCERKLGQLENVCASQPCLNGGQCVPTESNYQCQCAPGFGGDNCELDARVCQTQQPCGQSPDARCQSFRVGAALQHICILQDGLAYGLTAQQAVASPCNGADGPQALAVSEKGFIMCDGERMFVESCPGGTIWDDLNKACVWPDMQADIPQMEKSTSYGSYGQARQLIARPSFEQPQYGQSFTAQIKKPLFEQKNFLQVPVQGYGSQFTMQPAVEKKFISRVNVQQPVFEEQQQQTIQAPLQGYGSQINIQPALEKKFGQTLSSRLNVQKPAIEQQQQQQDDIVETSGQGYGSQITIQPAFESRKVAQVPVQDWQSKAQDWQTKAQDWQTKAQDWQSKVQDWQAKSQLQSVVQQPQTIQSSGY